MLRMKSHLIYQTVIYFRRGIRQFVMTPQIQIFEKEDKIIIAHSLDDKKKKKNYIF